MKALAIDSAVTCITLAACNQQARASVTLDIGMRQSERIVPAIEYVLGQAELRPQELDFIALSGGPGSFTGLRLGFAAAKGLQLSTGCPVYAIPTLEAQALPYSAWPGLVLSTIDAKKERFYVQWFSKGKALTAPLDLAVAEIVARIKDYDNILIVGADKDLLHDRLEPLTLHRFPFLTSTTSDALLQLGLKAFEDGNKGLEPHEGPFYIRKSEAEENLG